MTNYISQGALRQGDFNVLFQDGLYTETPPLLSTFPDPFLAINSFRFVATERRSGERPRFRDAPPPRGTSGGGSLPGWVDGAGRERARGRGGGSVSARRSGDQLAGRRAPNAAPALDAAPPPLRVAVWPGGRDNVAGLVTGLRPPSRLKWVPWGCCLAGRRGSGSSGKSLPRRVGAVQAGPKPSFLSAPGTEIRCSGARDACSALGLFSAGKCMKRFPRLMAFAPPRTQQLNF